jgi:hypothetical protein
MIRDDRDPRLGEGFVHVIGAVDRRRGAAGAFKSPEDEMEVGREVEGLAAVFRAERDAGRPLASQGLFTP